MGVKIALPSYLEPYTSGVNKIDVNGRTIGECLEHLVKQFPALKKMLFAENGALLTYVGVYLNGEDCYPNALAKPVKDGDDLQVMYIIEGG